MAALLIALLATWLVVVLLAVAMCRMAARGDTALARPGRDDAAPVRLRLVA